MADMGDRNHDNNYNKHKIDLNRPPKSANRRAKIEDESHGSKLAYLRRKPKWE